MNDRDLALGAVALVALLVLSGSSSSSGSPAPAPQALPPETVVSVAAVRANPLAPNTLPFKVYAFTDRATTYQLGTVDLYTNATLVYTGESPMTLPGGAIFGTFIPAKMSKAELDAIRPLYKAFLASHPAIVDPG